MAPKFWVGAPKFRVWEPKFGIGAPKFGIGHIIFEILAFQMPGAFILAWRTILLNIVRNGVFSKAGLQIPIKIPAIDKFTQMNYSKTQYIAMQCSSVPSFIVYIMANSLPSNEY